MDLPPETHARPRWHSTAHPRFRAAARIGDVWWVVRLNSFPEHPMWTLFIDGNGKRFDWTTGEPAGWGDPFRPTEPPLDAATARDALAPIEQFDVYGSEVGQPCEAWYCCGYLVEPGARRRSADVLALHSRPRHDQEGGQRTEQQR
ncbi:hypothetical protein [Catenulispora pinisilvae]|uniref:hypothetical protein n=1 Tax=Catenulispora pinisilvae TaxID=2705253 RepID=UPI001891B78F|nr:hypothetical protein [Catenulispora pinisilvae]